MRGLIYGDILGSVYEWKPVEEQKSITEPRHFTDDTVLGAAVADALIACRAQGIRDDEGIVRTVTLKLQEYGRRYPDAGYSRSFRAWMMSGEPEPYGSKTNGAIMRCTSAGWLAGSPEEARRLGRLTAMPTHNHPEAMDAAATTAEIIFRLRMGEPAEQMYAFLSGKYAVPVPEKIRPITEFDFTCKTTLPIAFAAFYEAAVSTEAGGKLRNRAIHRAAELAVSLGGDTDTNAAIAAAFAEAWAFAEGISETEMACGGQTSCCDGEDEWAACWNRVEKDLTPDLADVLRRFDEAVAEAAAARRAD